MFFKILAFVIGLILVILFVLVLIIILKGKGKPVQLKNKNGQPYKEGLSSRETILINNSQQTIFMLSKNINNPVLLFLHGGPGSPEMCMMDFKTETLLEDEFTVCYWEQRGAGLSYGARLSPEQMTTEQFVQDTHAVTEYLQKRFNQPQIYLMGHSWGTLLGIKAIEQKPAYYKAYFGIGQVTNQLLSEKLAHAYLLEHAKQINDKKAIKELQNINVQSPNFPTKDYMAGPRNKYLNEYGAGLLHSKNKKILSHAMWSFAFFRGYSVFDYIKFIKGTLYAMSYFPILMQEDFIHHDVKLEVPVYIFHGVYDKQVSFDLSHEYFEKLQAPKKRFFAYKNSAHAPNFEQAQEFIKDVFDCLKEEY